MSGPIETKVSAATIASAVSGLGLWALQTYVFKTDVPLPVIAAVTTVVPAVITFAVGYLAPHTPRPDLQARWRDAPDDGDHESWGDHGPWVAPAGRHALDDEPQDIPASQFVNPAATRYEGKQD